MTIERRMQALLDIVESDRRTQVEAIVGEARAVVATLLGQANRAARERMRQAFADERRQRDERVHAARANLQTRRRLAAQRCSSALLELTWRRLPDALLARWRDSAARRTWIAHVLALARTSLPPLRWQIDHEPGWPTAERDEVAAKITRDVGATPVFRADGKIRAGLRIAGGGAVIDCTLDGLLRDRAENGARLLAYFETAGVTA